MVAIPKDLMGDLASQLAEATGIPFVPDGDAVTFPRPLRITDWSVPLIFDGHAAHDGDNLMPVDFVGHVIWAHLESTTADHRTWWTCRLPPAAARAILDDVEGYDIT